ncbi:WD40/YVTN/BNR-like repeat-containing protein [Gracilimonas sp.]|uniref:WD40/YVTN/BNR-like repeat-containing protein n=1 Tax=Gracilimonas sp. TaxID=1974203 RepID=UPI003BAA0640
MKKLLLIFFFPAFLVSGCDIFNSAGSSKKKKIPAFEWREINYFVSDSITSVNTDINGDLYVGSKKRWYVSSDTGKTFKRYKKPDSTHFSHIERRDDTYYAIGEVVVEDIFWDSPIMVNKQEIYRSKDRWKWEKVIGPFKMYDIAFDDDNYMYISKLEGVVTVNLTDKSKYHTNFYHNSWWGSIVDVVATNSKGDIFAGCRGGMYKSSDRGKTWNKITNSIGKDYDDIKFLEVVEQDRIISIAVRRLLISNDDGQTWEKLRELDSYNNLYEGRMRKFEGVYPSNMDIMQNGYLYYVSSFGINIAHPDSITKFYNAGPEGYDYDRPFPYEEIKTFSNGDVLVYNSRKILFGKRNLNSEFWIKRL